jgi:hypothetical protein
MAKSYQHVTEPMLHEVGRQIGGPLRGGADGKPEVSSEDAA